MSARPFFMTVASGMDTSPGQAWGYLDAVRSALPADAAEEWFSPALALQAAKLVLAPAAVLTQWVAS